jgi:aminomethyltransferase
MVVNAATRDKDLGWINQQAESFNVEIRERPEFAMIAVQGPNAIAKVKTQLSDGAASRLDSLGVFYAMEADDMFIGHTGYTGEDGVEIILPEERASSLWQGLSEQGVAPIGLGARDTLRLEAGMNLYGSDMDESTTPLESGLGWTIAWEPEDRDFIGRGALQKQKEDKPAMKLVGLVLQGKGVLRNHQKVIVEGVGEGEITSGSFSPTLSRAIAFARVPTATGTECQVEMRGKLMQARVVKAPFVRNGKSCLPDDV